MVHPFGDLGPQFDFARVWVCDLRSFVLSGMTSPGGERESKKLTPTTLSTVSSDSDGATQENPDAKCLRLK
jgi:hypothetical protein